MKTHSLVLWLIALVVLAGCNKISKMTATNWYDKFGWKAEEYFDDPQVVALCNAIQANDLAEMDRLIAAGANVNAIGKDNMTPLLWAFPDEKLERFKKLLDHGANPNVLVKSDLGTRSVILPGTAVTHLVCKTSFPGYFEEVFAHGGNPNLVMSAFNDAPLFLVITFGGAGKDRIQYLLDKGADINYMNGTLATPVMQAVSWGGQYDLALYLLEKGADYAVYVPESNTRLVHIVLADGKRRSITWTAAQKNSYDRLCKWLEDHGESLVQAQADMDRWHSWNTATNEYRTLMDREVAERKEREAKAAANPANPKN